MEQTKYDVFISYSRKDYVDEHNNVIPGNEVSKIKEALTEAGITFWFDEERVYSGDEFAKKIVRSIKASKIFVFLSTVNSNQSIWTANEIATAHILNKKIVPVRIDKSVYHDDVILFISRLSHIDYGNNPEKGRRDLVRSINAYLEETKATEAKKEADEKRRQKELEHQRKLQEEEKKRQVKKTDIETEIAALESQKTKRKKVVLQKEQELKLAQVDLEACENKITRLQKILQELREPQISEHMRMEEERKVAEEKRLDEEANAKERVFTVGNVEFKMIRVDGGRFLMGAPNNDHDAYLNEKPQHWIKLSDFYIGETTVTQALWKAVMGNNPSSFHGDNNPVDSVKWDDCQTFIKILNEKTNQRFRLPTEAEWEFAASGGNMSKGCRFAGGNSIDEVAWFNGNSDFKTHQVKNKRPNELGLYDMSGNVYERCLDWYSDSYYEESPIDNPVNHISSSSRVLRGGSWLNRAKHCRVTDRYKYDPSVSDGSIGFRLVLPQNPSHESNNP